MNTKEWLVSVWKCWPLTLRDWRSPITIWRDTRAAGNPTCCTRTLHLPQPRPSSCQDVHYRPARPFYFSPAASWQHAERLFCLPTPTSTLLSIASAMDTNRSLSRRTVEGLIAAGHVVVIKEQMVLQLDDWLDKHPGGKLSVLHMVGRDATDEINA